MSAQSAAAKPLRNLGLLRGLVPVARGLRATTRRLVPRARGLVPSARLPGGENFSPSPLPFPSASAVGLGGESFFLASASASRLWFEPDWVSGSNRAPGNPLF